MNKLTDVEHVKVKIYARVRAGTTQAAVNTLFKWVDDAFSDNRMEEAEEFFKTLDLSLLDSNLVVAVLTCANWRRSDLKCWENLFMRLGVRLIELIPDRALRILTRFELAHAGPPKEPAAPQGEISNPRKRKPKPTE